MDCKWILAFLPYGGRWRKGRKLLHNYLHIGAASAFHPVQITAARRLVVDLLSKQERPSAGMLSMAVRLNVGQTIMRIVYGLDVKDTRSEFISLPEQLNRLLVESVMPGRFLVDLVPARKSRVAILCSSETTTKLSFAQYAMFQHGCLGPNSVS
jgi:cytochrome P450